MTFAEFHDRPEETPDADGLRQGGPTPDSASAPEREQSRILAENLRRLESANRELEARIQALTDSTSWRITRPLRGLMRLLRRDLTVGQVAEWAYGRVRRPAAPRPAEARASRGRPQLVSFPIRHAVIALPEVTGDEVPDLDVSVTVVIPTFNAGGELHWLLRKLRSQKGLAGVEIVVVDSGSTDRTVDLAERHGCKVVRIPPEAFSHSYARNLGADNANGELLLFTVQDAYPVGDYWLHALARALVQPRSEAERVAAVSCAEFPRRDSELIYNAAIDTHYRFLGCAEADRIGAMCGEDQLSLRTQGQLSDVACMISAATFQAYRYEGRYAEDLVLGVRLIRDGLRTGMLSSVKVVHSHTRPPSYHLKRTFVDLLFLSEAFPDLPLPPRASLAGCVAAAGQLKALVDAWRPCAGETAGSALFELAGRVRRSTNVASLHPAPIDFKVPGLSAWLAGAASGVALDADVTIGREMFAERLEHIGRYADGVYGAVDSVLADELVAAAEKCLAATFGVQLATHYLNQAGWGATDRQAELEALRSLLLSGV